MVRWTDRSRKAKKRTTQNIQVFSVFERTAVKVDGRERRDVKNSEFVRTFSVVARAASGHLYEYGKSHGDDSFAE